MMRVCHVRGTLAVVCASVLRCFVAPQTKQLAVLRKPVRAMADETGSAGNTFWACIQQAACDNKTDPEAYVTEVQRRAGQCMNSSHVVDRTAAVEALVRAIASTGAFTVVLGGKNLGKTFLTKAAVRNCSSDVVVLSANMRNMPGDSLLDAILMTANRSLEGQKDFSQSIANVAGVISAIASAMENLGPAATPVANLVKESISGIFTRSKVRRGIDAFLEMVRESSKRNAIVASKPERSESPPHDPRLANVSGSSVSTVLCCDQPSYEEPQQHSINPIQFFLFASLDEVSVLDAQVRPLFEAWKEDLGLDFMSQCFYSTIVVSASQETAVQKARRALKAMKKKQQSAGTSVKHTIQKTVTCMQLSVSGFCVHKTFFPAMKCAQTAQDSKAKSKDDDDACDTAAGESHAEASSSVKQPKPRVRVLASRSRQQPERAAAVSSSRKRKQLGSHMERLRISRNSPALPRNPSALVSAPLQLMTLHCPLSTVSSLHSRTGLARMSLSPRAREPCLRPVV